MLYIDTSVMVSALTEEQTTAAVQAWLGDVREPYAVSEWTVTEFSAALSIKLRTGQLDLGQRAKALSLFNQMILDSLSVLPVARIHFLTAAKLADQYDEGIRAGDALHLAIAAESGAELCTLDRRLAAAGPPAGVITRLIA